MTSKGRRRPSWQGRDISGDTVLIGLGIVTTVLVIGLSLLVLNGAARSNQDMAAAVETRVLGLLERSGLSGLVAEIDRQQGALVPGNHQIEFVVWRQSDGERRIIRETLPGLGQQIQQATGPRLRSGAKLLKPHAIDVATASRGWDLPMADVGVSYAISVPTPRTQSARRELAAVWFGFAIALSIGAAVHLDHRRRYRAGLDRINAVLDDFAAGNTAAKITLETRAPELKRLSDHLCLVLPRLDRLLNDLRALTAHLAHELRTPLQTIRADVDRLAQSGQTDERRTLAREINETIDMADARLRSVMQLYRLNADVQVPLEPDVDLSALLTDHVFDFEDFLIARNRHLRLDIAHDVRVTANVSLLDLLVGNLLSNAGKYAPENADIGVQLTCSDDQFQLCIWNSGSNFPADWIDRPIQRLDRAQGHQDIPGHGLGLALVDVIARQHGFGLRLANGGPPETPDQRASVVVTGPCAPRV